MILSHCAGERIHPFPPLAAFWLALALALLVPMTSHAMAQNRTILLDGSRGQYDLRQYVEVLEDRNYTIEQVSSPEFTDRFKRPGTGFLSRTKPERVLDAFQHQDRAGADGGSLVAAPCSAANDPVHIIPADLDTRHPGLGALGRRILEPQEEQLEKRRLSCDKASSPTRQD